MEQRTLACAKLLVLAGTLFRGTFGTEEASSIATLKTDAITTPVVTSEMDLADDTILPETIDDVVLVNYSMPCCPYENAVCAGINTICSSCTCLCQRNYIFDNLTMDCEAAEGVGAKVVQETEEVGQKGEGLPGKPCTNTSQCVEGLECNKTTCACPWPCEYIEKDLVCDCGEDVSNLVGAIFSGWVLGFAIFAFWSIRIVMTIVSFKERNKVLRMPPSAPGISTLGAAYGTDHMRPQALPPAVYPRSQAVAPFTPLAPGTWGNSPYVEASHNNWLNHQSAPPAPPQQLPKIPSPPSYEHIFGDHNPPNDTSRGLKDSPQYPSSAPEEWRSQASSMEKKAEDAPLTSDFFQPSRSAKF